MSKDIVYIIESPSDIDCLKGKYEGHLLTKALKVFSISYRYNMAVNLTFFKKAVDLLMPWIQKKHFPILHISAHGNADGIQLTDRTFIKWEDLKKILTPLNEALSGALCMGISSCSGFSACKMAMSTIGKLPFFALVGPTKDIPLADINMAFVTFYYRFFKKQSSGKDAVEAMKIASNNPNFGISLASHAKDQWEKKMVEVYKELQASKK